MWMVQIVINIIYKMIHVTVNLLKHKKVILKMRLLVTILIFEMIVMKIIVIELHQVSLIFQMEN